MRLKDFLMMAQIFYDPNPSKSILNINADFEEEDLFEEQPY